MELIMQCQATAALNTYLNEEDRVYQQYIHDKEIAQNEAEKIVKSHPHSVKFNSLMEFINDSASFVNDFDECIHAVINNVNEDSHISVKNLREFMLKMAFESSLESLRKSNEN